MSMPDSRIRLRIEGELPQDISETIALVLDAALKFCAQPAVFPAFRTFAVREHSGPYAEALAKLPRPALTEIQVMIAAGVLADLEATS